MEKQKTDVVTLVLLCAVILLGGYVYKSRNTTDHSKYEQKIDSLDIAISMLEKEQLIKDSLLNTYKQELDSLHIEKRATEKEINDIRLFYGKAIRDINKLSTAQLDSFFTARYNRTRL